MSLALQNRGNGSLAAHHGGGEAIAQTTMSFDQIWEMAGYAAKSRMFGVETPEQAFCLMMICQAKGLHPIDAVLRYHIVKGRPTMRADAMQAEFQARGGVIKILERNAQKVRAAFSHPVLQPEPVEFSFSFEDAKRAGLAPGGMYDKYPDVMLWARLVTKAIRAIHPGIVAGIYSPEEAEEIAMRESPTGQIATARAEATRAIAEADTPLPGHDPRQADTRPYSLVATEAVDSVNRLVAENWGSLPDAPAPLDSKRMHGLIALKAFNLGYADGQVPTKVQAAVAVLSKVYASHRQWVRQEIARACADHETAVAETLKARRDADAVTPEEESQDANDADPDDVTYPDEPGSRG